MKGIKTEGQFEKRIREIINRNIISQNPNLQILDNHKGTDILICKSGEDPKLFFLEIKYYNKSHGRLGFGHANGAGFQPEMLQKRPSFFEKYLRWILGSIDNEQYYFLTNEEIFKYISGGAIDYKQNNFNPKLFSEEKGININELSNKLSIWLNES